MGTSMNRFDEGRDPLAERVSDDELREILQRLGEADFGGDERATVGVVVEVTGVDLATVLRLLGEIRQRDLDAHREALAAVESRVARLESRPIPPSRVVYREREEPSESSKAVGAIALLLSVFVAWTVYLAASQSSPAQGAIIDGAAISNDVGDGTLTFGPDGQVVVLLRGGGTRPITHEEKARADAFATAARRQN